MDFLFAEMIDTGGFLFDECLDDIGLEGALAGTEIFFSGLEIGGLFDILGAR